MGAPAGIGLPGGGAASDGRGDASKLAATRSAQKWNLARTIREAQALQDQLRVRVDVTAGLPHPPRLVAGLDVSYEKGTSRVAAAAVVVSLPTLEVVESAIIPGEVTFPYVPGLLAFRELPFVLKALENLAVQPDVLVCDGYGVAHPRRFGLACHVGVMTGIPTFGVAKTPFMVDHADPGPSRGDWSPLVDGDEILGRAVRTQTRIKPVFVSAGHLISLGEAADLTLALCPRYRIPEVVRQADHLSRQALKP